MSGARSSPISLAARAHCRVSGAVGQAITTEEMEPASSSWRANSRAGRVLPAPGAAEMRNEPLLQAAISARARVCQGRRGEFVDRVRSFDMDAPWCRALRTKAALPVRRGLRPRPGCARGPGDLPGTPGQARFQPLNVSGRTQFHLIPAGVVKEVGAQFLDWCESLMPARFDD